MLRALGAIVRQQAPKSLPRSPLLTEEIQLSRSSKGRCVDYFPMADYKGSRNPSIRLDKSSLLRLAEGGLGDFPPAKLGDLADWCRDYCWATGQVAYCILGDLFSLLFIAWDNPISSSTDEAMSAVLKRDIPQILESDNESARVLTLTLREEVSLILAS